MPLMTCLNFYTIKSLECNDFASWLIVRCFFTLPAYALDAGEFVFSGDRITVSQKASCLASKQAQAIGQTCQLASVRDFDRGHIFKTALMD